MASEFCEEPTHPHKKLWGLQAAIYTAAGGGFLGGSFAHSPKTAYIDSRVSRSGRLPKVVYILQRALVQEAVNLGLNPNELPPMPDLPELHPERS